MALTYDLLNGAIIMTLNDP